MLISDWSSDVCSSDLGDGGYVRWYGSAFGYSGSVPMAPPPDWMLTVSISGDGTRKPLGSMPAPSFDAALKALSSIDPNELDRDSWRNVSMVFRSEAHQSELQYIMRISSAVFCSQTNIKKQKQPLHT